MKPISTLIVDDNSNFINATQDYLSTEPEIDVVDVAFSGSDSIELIAGQKPDLVLMSFKLLEMSGFKVINRIQALPVVPKVIILSTFDFTALRDAAKTAGADGFIAKAELAEELMHLVVSIFFEDEEQQANDDTDSMPIDEC